MEKDKPSLDQWLDPDFLRSKRMDRRSFLQEVGRITALSLSLTLSGALLENFPVEAAPRFPFLSLYPWSSLGGPHAGQRRPVDPAGPGSPERRRNAAPRLPVRWEVAARAEGFRRIVPNWYRLCPGRLAHSVQSEVSGLSRTANIFTVSSRSELSPVGRTKSFRSGLRGSGLSFAFASCQHYEHGFYTAYRRMAEEDLDLDSPPGRLLYRTRNRRIPLPFRQRPVPQQPKAPNPGRVPQPARPVQDRSRSAESPCRFSMGGGLG